MSYIFVEKNVMPPIHYWDDVLHFPRESYNFKKSVALKSDNVVKRGPRKPEMFWEPDTGGLGAAPMRLCICSRPAAIG